MVTEVPQVRSAPLTRVRLLDAAETLFGERGFDATRLEDVAQAVGIRRASIVYHFPDKPAVYHAVLERLLEALQQALSRAFSEPLSAALRIEAAVDAWLEFLRTRPAFGRLLLRELASAGSSDGALAARAGGFDTLIRQFLAELAARDEQLKDAVDPAHFAASILGATLVYGVALPTVTLSTVASDLARDGGHERHRSEVLRITRRLMGVDLGRPQQEAQ